MCHSVYLIFLFLSLVLLYFYQSFLISLPFFVYSFYFLSVAHVLTSRISFFILFQYLTFFINYKSSSFKSTLFFWTQMEKIIPYNVRFFSTGLCQLWLSRILTMTYNFFFFLKNPVGPSHFLVKLESKGNWNVLSPRLGYSISFFLWHSVHKRYIRWNEVHTYDIFCQPCTFFSLL